MSTTTMPQEHLNINPAQSEIAITEVPTEMSFGRQLNAAAADASGYIEQGFVPENQIARIEELSSSILEVDARRTPTEAHPEGEHYIRFKGPDGRAISQSAARQVRKAAEIARAGADVDNDEYAYLAREARAGRTGILPGEELKAEGENAWLGEAYHERQRSPDDPTMDPAKLEPADRYMFNRYSQERQARVTAGTPSTESELAEAQAFAENRLLDAVGEHGPNSWEATKALAAGANMLSADTRFRLAEYSARERADDARAKKAGELVEQPITPLPLVEPEVKTQGQPRDGGNGGQEYDDGREGINDGRLRAYAPNDEGNITLSMVYEGPGRLPVWDSRPRTRATDDRRVIAYTADGRRLYVEGLTSVYDIDDVQDARSLVGQDLAVNYWGQPINAFTKLPEELGTVWELPNGNVTEYPVVGIEVLIESRKDNGELPGNINEWGREDPFQAARELLDDVRELDQARDEVGDAYEWGWPGEGRTLGNGDYGLDDPALGDTEPIIISAGPSKGAGRVKRAAHKTMRLMGFQDAPDYRPQKPQPKRETEAQMRSRIEGPGRHIRRIKDIGYRDEVPSPTSGAGSIVETPVPTPNIRDRQRSSRRQRASERIGSVANRAADYVESRSWLSSIQEPLMAHPEDLSYTEPSRARVSDRLRRGVRETAQRARRRGEQILADKGMFDDESNDKR